MTKTLALVLLLLGGGDTRHAQTVRAFQRATGYPHGRAGYVVDHIIPLCAGGADAVTNMQWQALADSKAKDRYERGLCAAMRKQGLTMVKKTEAR